MKTLFSLCIALFIATSAGAQISQSDFDAKFGGGSAGKFVPVSGQGTDLWEVVSLDRVGTSDIWVPNIKAGRNGNGTAILCNTSASNGGKMHNSQFRFEGQAAEAVSTYNLVPVVTDKQAPNKQPDGSPTFYVYWQPAVK